MKPSIKLFLYSLITCLLLSACGTKGPLYIPEQQYPQPSTEAK